MKGKNGLLLICLFMVNLVSAQVKVTGNGEVITREFDIIDYNKIYVNGFFDVIYEQSDAEPYMEVTLDENLMPFVDVEIKNRQLNIKFKGIKVEKLTTGIIKTNSKWLREAKIAGNAGFTINTYIKGDELIIKGQDNSLIQTKQPLELGKLDLNVSGSANIIIENLLTDHLDCNITGTGSMKLVEGKTKTAIYFIKNSGLIQAYGVIAEDATAKVMGGGTMEINITQKLNAQMMGNGIIRYKGQPRAIQQKKVGKGNIDPVEE